MDEVVLVAQAEGWTRQVNFDSGEYELLQFGEAVVVPLDVFNQAYASWEWLLRMIRKKLQERFAARGIDDYTITWECKSMEWMYGPEIEEEE